MSEAFRPTRRKAHSRPRRAFDRSIAVARFRWEILRRTADYRADFSAILRQMAAASGHSEALLTRDCVQQGGGILLPGVGQGLREHYDQLCAHYGLTALVHPDVSFTDDEMAAFPVFADTPARQPVVTDLDRLRHVARHGGDVSSRTLQRIFAQRRMKPGPFQPTRKRLHLGRSEMLFAVFDAHVGRKPLVSIAKHLGLGLDQTKRAWAAARGLVSKWVDFDSHLRSCETCQRYVHGRRDRMCPKVEQQIGLRRTGRSRLRPMNEGSLALLQARSQGDLPARRASTDRGSRRGRHDG